MRTRKWRWVGPLALAFASIPVFAMAGQVVLPNIFSNGEIADADHVNANFSALANAVNDTEDRVTVLEGQAPTQVLRARVVPGDPAASGQNLLDVLTGIGGNAADLPMKVRMDPGIYAVAETLYVPRNVTLCGAGDRSTHVRTTATTGFWLFANSGLRQFRIEHTPPSASVCVNATTAGPVDLRDLEILSEFASGAGSHTAISLAAFAVAMSRVSISMKDPTVNPTTSIFRGISAGGTDLTCRDCSICVDAATAVGINMFSTGTSTLEGCSVFAVGLNGGAGRGVRVSSNGSPAATVHDSRISGTTFSLDQGQFGSPAIRVANSQVVGATNGANVKLVHCHDANFDPIP